MNLDLTVLIPTYNRKSQLKRTLDALYGQSDKDFKIFISDNNSNYSIENEVLKNYPTDFLQCITLHKQRANMGADMNIASVLASCDTQWGWLLGDDDAIDECAVENIKKKISENPACSAFWFCISHRQKEDVVMQSMEDLLEMLKINRFNGDWIFMSNKVYNLRDTEQYFEEMFFRLYTRIPHCIPILEMLKNHKKVEAINSVQIVRHAPLENDITWEINSTLTGMRTIMDYNFGLSFSKHKEIVKYIMFRPGFVIRRYLKQDKLPWNYKMYLNVIFDETYCRVYNFPVSWILWGIAKVISTPIGFKVGKFFAKIEGK